MLKKVTGLTLIALVIGATVALSAENVKLKAYVIDNACAARAKGDGAVDKVKSHSVKCSLMPACSKSGYSVITDDGKLYKLDEAGNKKMLDLLTATKVEKGFAVNIEGMIDGDTLKVTSISEAQ